MKEKQNRKDIYINDEGENNGFDKAVKKSKKKSRRNKLLGFAVVLVILVVGIYYCMMNVFKVQKIEVVDMETKQTLEMPYTQQQLMDGFGVAKGMGLYEISTNAMAQNAKYKLTYIEDIKISRKWPDTIVAKIEKELSRFYMTIDNKLYILSDELKVLDANANIEEIEINNLILLHVSNIKKCVEGEILEIDKEDEKIILEVSKLLFDEGVGNVVTMLDVRDRFDIELMYNTRYLVKLGDSKELKNKLGMMKVIIEEKSDEIVSGTIDVAEDFGKTGTFERFS